MKLQIQCNCKESPEYIRGLLENRRDGLYGDIPLMPLKIHKFEVKNESPLHVYVECSDTSRIDEYLGLPGIVWEQVE